MCILKKRELHINIKCVGNVFCTSSVCPCVHKWAILRFSPYVPPREMFFVVTPRCNSTGLQEGASEVPMDSPVRFADVLRKSVMAGLLLQY